MALADPGTPPLSRPTKTSILLLLMILIILIFLMMMMIFLLKVLFLLMMLMYGLRSGHAQRLPIPDRKDVSTSRFPKAPYYSEALLITYTTDDTCC